MSCSSPIGPGPRWGGPSGAHDIAMLRHAQYHSMPPLPTPTPRPAHAGGGRFDVRQAEEALGAAAQQSSQCARPPVIGRHAPTSRRGRPRACLAAGPQHLDRGMAVAWCAGPSSTAVNPSGGLISRLARTHGGRKGGDCTDLLACIPPGTHPCCPILLYSPSSLPFAWD